MNRTLKEARLSSFHYASHNELKQHLHAYLMAYNFAKRLKAIKGNILQKLEVYKQFLFY